MSGLRRQSQPDEGTTFEILFPKLEVGHEETTHAKSEVPKGTEGIRRDIPIILCTGYSEMIDEGKAKEVGSRSFVMKPLNRRNIAEVIR
jgi:CheY-like chemotaxis protein